MDVVMLLFRFMTAAEDYVVGQPGGGEESEPAHYKPGPEKLRVMLGLDHYVCQETGETGGGRPEDAENGPDNCSH